jgi:hypothetical protein
VVVLSSDMAQRQMSMVNKVQVQGTFTKLLKIAHTGSVIDLGGYRCDDWGFSDRLIIQEGTDLTFIDHTGGKSKYLRLPSSETQWQSCPKGIVFNENGRLVFFDQYTESITELVKLSSTSVWYAGPRCLAVRTPDNFGGAFSLFSYDNSYKTIINDHLSSRSRYQEDIDWQIGEDGIVIRFFNKFYKYSGHFPEEIWQHHTNDFNWKVCGRGVMIQDSNKFTFVDYNHTYTEVVGLFEHSDWQVGNHGIVIRNGHNFSLVVIK